MGYHARQASLQCSTVLHVAKLTCAHVGVKANDNDTKQEGMRRVSHEHEFEQLSHVYSTCRARALALALDLSVRRKELERYSNIQGGCGKDNR